MAKIFYSLGLLTVLFMLYSCESSDGGSISSAPSPIQSSFFSISNITFGSAYPSVSISWPGGSVPDNLREYWTVLICDSCNSSDTDVAFWFDSFNADPNVGSPSLISSTSFIANLSSGHLYGPVRHSSSHDYTLRIYAIANEYKSSIISSISSSFVSGLLPAGGGPPYDFNSTGGFTSLVFLLDSDPTGYVLGSTSLSTRLP